MADSSSELSDWPSEAEPQPLNRPQFKSKAEEVEWERKQRNREYRVAARREKRTRKADEKKQRKLNATILRRMTKNPEKYNKNVDRNRRREVQLERFKIWREAVAQAERLAAIHDPTGKIFNVGPVVVQEDGKVVSVEVLERRARIQAEKAANSATPTNGANGVSATNGDHPVVGVNPARQALIDTPGNSGPPAKRMSKTQQRKLAMLEDRPPPPKPVIPEGISVPEGEENWLSLWDYTDAQLERRVLAEKKRKANERKALRQKQQAGKKERRAARDERRKVYREKKLEWKAIKEDEKRHKRSLERVEQEETKKIEVEVNLYERRRAMEVCAELGFTLENVEGVEDIKPRALGMKGREVDFSILEVGDKPSELKIKGEKPKENQPSKSGRVDLGLVADESRARLMAADGDDEGPAGLDGDFVSFDMADMPGQEIGSAEFNHKLRRKLRRAIEAAQVRKELLVRKKAVEYCQEKGIDVPQELVEEYKPIKLSNRRILEDGTVETEKQERTRKRLELAEYNKAAKILRKQAKGQAIEAGLRKFAVLNGILPGEAESPQSVTETLPGIQILTGNEPEKSVVSKKRNRDDEEVERKVKKSKISEEGTNGAVENGNGPKKSKARRDEEAAEEPKNIKKKKTESSSRGATAHQWNPDALTGGDARKDKFLRLLGANKVNGTDDSKTRRVSSKIDLGHVQDELERQFESGIRMKHDGQGKRRGLGA